MLSNDELLLRTNVNEIVDRIDANVEDAKTLFDTKEKLVRQQGGFSGVVSSSFSSATTKSFNFSSFDLNFDDVIDGVFDGKIDIVAAFENKIEDIIDNIGLDIKRIIKMFTNFSLSRVTAIIKARMVKFIKKIIQNIIDKVKEKLLKVFEKLVKFYARIKSLMAALLALAEDIATTVSNLKSDVSAILAARETPYSDPM